MLSMVKMLLKGEVGGSALNSHGNYIVDHGNSWKNHGILFLNFCGNPVGRALYWGSKGGQFKSYCRWSHCVVSLSNDTLSTA